MVRVAQPASDEINAETFAATLTDRFLQCRDFGHNWRPLTVDYDRKSRSYYRQLRCVSCRTIRKQLLDGSGHVVTNSYAYADGYLTHHFQRGTYSRDVFRAEALTRFLSKHSDEAAS